MEEISNKDLLGEIAILNGKINILVSLFERIEHTILSCAEVSNNSYRDYTKRIKDDYKGLREKIEEYENTSRKLIEEANANGEL